MSVIKGLEIIPVKRYCDDRGFFSEVFRDSSKLMDRIRQVSYTETYGTGIVKAFHYHKHQSDIWFPCKGMMEIGLIDLRKGPTEGNLFTVYAGEDDPKIIVIPPMVAHGYKVLGNEKVGLFYLTDQEYHADNPDEYRIEWNSTLYDWDTKNR